MAQDGKGFFQVGAVKGLETGQIQQRREVLRARLAQVQVFEGHAAQSGKIGHVSIHVQQLEGHPAQRNNIGDVIIISQVEVFQRHTA